MLLFYILCKCFMLISLLFIRIYGISVIKVFIDDLSSRLLFFYVNISATLTWNFMEYALSKAWSI